MGQAIFKFGKLPEEKWGMYDRVPLNLPVLRQTGERLTLSARSILDKIFTFTRKKKVITEKKEGAKTVLNVLEKTEGCRFTYEQLREEYGRARSTVARGLEELREAGYIKKVDRDVDGTEYVYDGEPTSGKYFIIPLYLYTVEVFVDGTYRRLTAEQVRVLAYLMNECASPKNGGKPGKGGGVCSTSYRKLARELKLSEGGVRKTIKFLMKEAKLISRPEGHRGKNGKKLSGYEVRTKLYVYKKYIKKVVNKEEDARIRTEYYADLREQAELRAEKYGAIVKKDKEYKANYKARRELEIEEVKAELKESPELLSIRQKMRHLRGERDRILRRLGFTLADISIQHSCPLCKDTGKHKDRWCTCFPGGEWRWAD